MKKNSIRAKHLDFIIIDILCLFSTLWLSYLLWIPEREKGSRGDDYRAIGLVLVLAYLFIVFTRPAHSGILRRSVLKELRQTLLLNAELLTIHELFTTYVDVEPVLYNDTYHHLCREYIYDVAGNLVSTVYYDAKGEVVE